MSRIGLRMGPVCVLTVPGQRTGKPRSTLVSPLTVGGGRYVVAALPDSDWARNIRAAGHAVVSRGRRREPVTLIEVTDSTLKEHVMRAYPREVPRGAPMFVRAGITGSSDPDAYSHSGLAYDAYRLPPERLERQAVQAGFRPVAKLIREPISTPIGSEKTSQAYLLLRADDLVRQSDFAGRRGVSGIEMEGFSARRAAQSRSGCPRSRW
jgi:deazaflavin-dependent oxidoreductase (nitroreductase family)